MSGDFLHAPLAIGVAERRLLGREAAQMLNERPLPLEHRKAVGLVGDRSHVALVKLGVLVSSRRFDFRGHPSMLRRKQQRADSLQRGEAVHVRLQLGDADDRV